MRPLARQSARLASHSRSSSHSRIRHPSIAQCQHIRPFSSTALQRSDARPPNGNAEHDARAEKERDDERRSNAPLRKPADAQEDKVKTSGDRRSSFLERKRAGNGHARSTKVPDPPPIPDWFLKHNVFLTHGEAARGGTEVLRCVDAHTGHTLFTIPYYEPPAQKMPATIRGQEVDISALGLEKDTISALPEHMKEEMVIHHAQVQRAKKADQVDQLALGELLTDLPRDMAEEILRREANEGKRKLRDKTADHARDGDVQTAKDKRKTVKLAKSKTALGQNFFDQKYSAQAQPSAKINDSTQKMDWMTMNGFKSKGSGEDFPPLSWSLLEAETAVRAGLSMATSPPRASSFATDRVDLCLNCADSQSHAAMDRLVAGLASSVGADVVRVDANDFAELADEYVGGGQDSPGSFSTLGYDTFAGWDSGSSIDDANKPFGRSYPDDDEFDMDEEEEDDEAEDQDDSNVGSRDIDDIRRTLHDKGHPVLRILKDMGVSVAIGTPVLSARRPPPPMLGPFSGPRRDRYEIEAEEVNYHEGRLAALLDSLLDAAKKRREAADVFESDSSNTDLLKLDTARMLLNYLRSGAVVASGVKATKLEMQQSPHAATMSASTSGTTSQCTIIHVRDIRELQRSSLGTAIIHHLAKVVQKRRLSGEPVLIVGTSTQDKADSMFLSRDSGSAGDFPFRAIEVPSLLNITKPDERQKAEQKLKAAHRAQTLLAQPPDAKSEDRGEWRILEINCRHIISMMRRIRPEQSLDLTGDKAKAQVTAQEGRMLGEKVLSMHQVQRLVLTAIGLAESHAKAEVVQPVHLALATHITGHADKVAGAWQMQSQFVEVPPTSLLKTMRGGKDVANGGESSADSAGPSKVEQISKSGNQHEKKLLSGVVDAKNIKTGFSDVHAPKETIEALKTLTSLSLLRPEAFTYGVLAADRLPGLMLYGPPGTGKTLLAKAVAKESKATVLEISGAQIYEKYVGEGEKMVRAVFSLAKKLSPCIVFIDEADAIFGSRSGAGNRNTHREIINQFLREWDGMDDHRVFMMVASNRPFDLDDAVLRRLPRRLLVDLPMANDREGILGIHLKNEQLDDTVSLVKLSEQTPLYSGSDLKNLCVAAALACVREENELLVGKKDEADFKLPEKRTLSARHFETAIREISASISEDMSSLTAIRKFDEQYGDRKGRRKKSGYGFGMNEGVVDEASARVRDTPAAPPP